MLQSWWRTVPHARWMDMWRLPFCVSIFRIYFAYLFFVSIRIYLCVSINIYFRVSIFVARIYFSYLFWARIYFSDIHVKTDTKNRFSQYTLKIDTGHSAEAAHTNMYLFQHLFGPRMYLCVSIFAHLYLFVFGIM